MSGPFHHKTIPDNSLDAFDHHDVPRFDLRRFHGYDLRSRCNGISPDYSQELHGSVVMLLCTQPTTTIMVAAKTNPVMFL